MAQNFARWTQVALSDWGSFEVEVQKDRIVATKPFPEDPHNSRIPVMGANVRRWD